MRFPDTHFRSLLAALAAVSLAAAPGLAQAPEEFGPFEDNGLEAIPEPDQAFPDDPAPAPEDDSPFLALPDGAVDLGDGVAVAPADDFSSVIQGQRAWLRALNKVTAFTQDLTVGFDQPLEFGSLTVVVRYCSRRPPELIPETFVFLEIHDRPVGGGAPAAQDAEESPYGYRIFSGWMLGSSPALHGLEHPVYDIWPVACETAREAEARLSAESGAAASAAD